MSASPVEGLRERLEQRLALAVDGGRWELAAAYAAALVDSWPVLAALEQARQRWRSERDPAALVILARADELQRLARGEELDEHAPLPGERASLPPGVERVAVEELSGRRARLARALARGVLRAVLVGGRAEGPEQQLALGELRLEGSHQRMVERFGLQALELSAEQAAEDWRWGGRDGLGSPSPGQPGPVLVAACQGRFLPGPPSALRAGRPQRVGWLLWDAPVRPIMVAPVAVAVLSALDGTRDTHAIAELLRGPVEGVGEVLDELVALGAATAL
jgi:hypothetical protein